MSEFARHINLKGPYRIYDVRNGKNGISKDLASSIHAKFSNFNLGWILTGEGEVFRKEDKGESEQLINDKEEKYNLLEITIPQTDFSSLVETLNRQQKTIESQARTIEHLSKKKSGNNENGNIAGTA